MNETQNKAECESGELVLLILERMARADWRNRHNCDCNASGHSSLDLDGSGGYLHVGASYNVNYTGPEMPTAVEGTRVAEAYHNYSFSRNGDFGSISRDEALKLLAAVKA